MNNTIRMPDIFLSINKEHFGRGLKANDLIILSQIEEFNRNERDCYMTDEQFMNILGCQKSAVRSSLERLEEQGFIIRETKVVKEHGRANRQRVIKLKNKFLTEPQSSDYQTHQNHNPHQLSQQNTTQQSYQQNNYTAYHQNRNYSTYTASKDNLQSERPVRYY